MEAAAMDKLIEKGNTSVQLAQAIGEALDITLKAANLVTVPMLDARFAQCEARMEARFGTLEKSLETTKVWAVLLYAGLVVALFGILAVQQVRTDRLIAQDWARTERLIEEDRARTDRSISDERARTDKSLAEEDARMEKSNAEQHARAEQAEARLDAKFDQLRTLLSRRVPSGL
jgi:hypothetical protein